MSEIICTFCNDNALSCGACDDSFQDMNECPRHEGAFDCSPFCELCEGRQEYDPNATLKCRVPECVEQITKDIWETELGFCIEHSNAYWNHELDPFTLERIIVECEDNHEWIGSPLYCSACGVDKGEERQTQTVTKPLPNKARHAPRAVIG